MSLLDLVTGLLLATGVFFFLAGSIGLLRLPDVISRIHALTKADNVGLACIAIAMSLNAPNVLAAIKIILVWLIILAGSSLLVSLIAQRSESLSEFNRR